MVSVVRFRALAFAALLLGGVACSGNHSGDGQATAAAGDAATAATDAAGGASAATAAPAAASDYAHVPVYPSHVVKTDKMGPGEYAIDTSDSIDEVVAWFKQNLPDQTGYTVTSDGAHLFYTKSGSTVDVDAETGHKFDPTDKARTTIGVQNAK
jgi:hypothetical protein